MTLEMQPGEDKVHPCKRRSRFVEHDSTSSRSNSPRLPSRYSHAHRISDSAMQFTIAEGGWIDPFLYPSRWDRLPEAIDWSCNALLAKEIIRSSEAPERNSLPRPISGPSTSRPVTVLYFALSLKPQRRASFA